MSFLRHLLLAAAYTVIAAAIAIALPKAAPALDANFAVMIGGVVLLGCALLHEMFARQEDNGKLADELYDLRATAAQVMKEIRDVRADAARISRDMMALSGRSPPPNLEEEIREVRAELKVLQTLVDELSPGARRTAAPGPAAVEPVQTARTPRREADDAAILATLQDALKRDMVEIALQPIVALPQRRIRFYEGFTRVRAPDGQVFTPEQYVAIAEREKLIPAIDNVLLFRAVQLLRKVQKKSRGMAFFCNISPHSLSDRKFFADFLEFITENAELAPNLVFEFSQSIVMARDPAVEAHLDRLAALGFRFSMDQVMSVKLDVPSLAERGFRYVKIGHDRLLAEQENPQTGVSMRDLKRQLARHGIQLIAEKIESEAKLLEVLDLDVDYGQGYLFGEPSLDFRVAA